MWVGAWVHFFFATFPLVAVVPLPTRPPSRHSEMNRFLQAPLSLRFGLSHLKRSRWQSFEYRSRLQSLCVRHFGGASPDSDSKRKGGPTKGGDRIRSLLSSGRGNSLDEKGANLSKADIVRRLQKYVWPAADDPDVPNVAGVKARVIGSVALLIASKAVLIQVPYFFKRLIDTMGSSCLR